MRRAVPLDRWTVRDVDPGAGDATGPGDDWMPIAAPGDVYQALVAAGRLEHPFKARNEAAAAWVRDREWWWRTEFTAPDWSDDEAVDLAFDGLDTFAEVYLDGVSLGRTDNMFHAWRFDLAGRVTPGATHRLDIRFDPTALALEGRTPPPPWAAFTDRISRSKRNLMRKAQFGWGWDWGPDLPTVGVWKAARIEVRPQTRIEDVRFAVRSLSEARVEAVVEAAATHSGQTAHVTLTGPDGAVVFDRRVSTDQPVAITLDQPRLWWTADLGEQPLYDLHVRLMDGDAILDETRRRVGLRTIALDQSPDPGEPGATFFRFVLNGRPIFARGACWVPATSFVADAENEPYARLIGQMVDANMNMIRVWGGGIYEPDVFYDLCDERGVLVWQDFMFACAPYPDDDAFAASVREEVDHQVRRLRHHPSIALWCGNNENQAIHRINVDVSGVDTPLPGAALYDDLIPGLLAQLDPETPYWPGSPWGGAHPNGMKAGDVHDWTVWHGIPPIPDDHMIEPFGYAPEKIVYQRYAEDTARFVSEFGIQAAPALATLKRWLDPADLHPDAEGFEQRIKDEAKKALAMIAPVTGPAETIQDYIDFTQWTQAEGLAFGIEHFRRRRPHCSGALIWQFNDCWPCVSWSLVDYDGVEKAAFFAVRRAFALVMASFEKGGDETILWLTNDSRETLTGEIVVSLETLYGQTIWQETRRFSVAPDSHAQPWRGPTPTAADQVLRVRSETDAFPANRLLAAPIKDLPLTPGAAPRMTTQRISETELAVTLTADAYLPFVHIVSDRADLRFSDNHFDLAGAETRVIRVSSAAALSPDDLTVRCWNLRT